MATSDNQEPYIFTFPFKKVKIYFGYLGGGAPWEHSAVNIQASIKCCYSSWASKQSAAFMRHKTPKSQMGGITLPS